MKKKILIQFCILFTLSFIVGSAQQDTQEQAGIIEISDDIEPYNGSIGPGSVLYGIKLAFENLDEGFTFNSTRKLEKQEINARLRIAEAKSELEQNKFEDAETALERFREKVRESEDLVSGFEDKDTGLLQAQKMNVKHQFVLARLLESHPNVTGLQRAFNNSVELEDRFALRTGTILTRIESEDRQRLKLREMEEERIKVRARITDNASDNRVEVRFLSTSTERDAIAQEILERFRLSRENISSMLDIEVEKEDLQRELDAKAEIRNNISHVEAEFRFPLNVTNRTEVTEGIFFELSNLKKSDILDVLDIRSEDRIEIRREIERSMESENLEIKAETFANSSDVKVELEFLTEKNESTAIAQEIRNKLNLRREEIDDILKLEAKDDQISLREKLEIEVEAENGASGLKVELRFPLNTTSRSQIVERIYQKLSTLTISASDLEFREKRDDRRQDRQEDRQEDRIENRQEDIREDRQENRSDDRSGRTEDSGKSDDN